MPRLAYSNDLTDTEWNVLLPHTQQREDAPVGHL